LSNIIGCPIIIINMNYNYELNLHTQRVEEACRTKDLAQFDLAIDNIKAIISKANNSIPASQEEVCKLKSLYPSASSEIEFEQQLCFLGKVSAGIRKQLVEEAMREGKLTNMNTNRINMWCSPRTVSTALMRSFAQREDTRVYDEPFYGAYLHKNKDRAQAHPQEQEVIGGMLVEPNRIVDEIILGLHTKPIIFFKQITHHLYMSDTPIEFLKDTTNVILTRDPRKMIPSLTKDLKKTIDIVDTGYNFQYKLVQDLKSFGQKIVVLDSDVLIKEPKLMLKKLCAEISIDFDEKMLSWKSGPSGIDGNWGKYWYGTATKSNGFCSTPSRNITTEHQALISDCMSYYNELMKYAITA
jgi:hypothetical protein